MIIRKPYAFLIKNFKKIHVVLLVLSIFVLFKLTGVSSFVNDFMRYGIYDIYGDPITAHITFLLRLSVFLLAIGSGALILLLRHKQKPWKAYLIPFIEYVALFFVLSMIKSFFDGYSPEVETTDLRMSRDLLLLFLVAQVPAIIVFVIRTFGLDLKKFNFNSDEEFLQLSEEDREEFEISLDFDTNSLIRLGKRLWRNIKYFYDEHKLICKTVFVIIGLIFLYKAYIFIFVTSKSYKEGQIYKANGYTIKVENSYFTDKDNKGDVIASNSNFVVIEYTITNNAAPRKLNMNNFHLKYGKLDYTTTEKTYADEFSDLGKAYEKVKELKRDETLNFIAIYKVPKKLNKKRFVLYYQENSGILRKIKLKIKDISKVKDMGKFSLGDEITLKFPDSEEMIDFETCEVKSNVNYIIRTCNHIGCTNEQRAYEAKENFKILEISFASDTFEAKNMIDFLHKYGKIVYKDSSGVEQTMEIENSISRKYFGKIIYLKVPNDIEEAKDLHLSFTIRNRSYTYKLT